VSPGETYFRRTLPSKTATMATELVQVEAFEQHGSRLVSRLWTHGLKRLSHELPRS
jgi:hypothetical protein